jgi:hypothetical protein
MNDFENAVDTIRHMTAGELNRIVEEIKLRRTYLARQSAVSFAVGDRVSFAARGMQVLGTVTKVNTKTILVKQSNTATVWKVHASLLKPVKEMA